MASLADEVAYRTNYVFHSRSPSCSHEGRRDFGRRESRMARSTRGILYALARFLGDVNAVKRGRVGRRVGRRIAGKATGRALGRLFR